MGCAEKLFGLDAVADFSESQYPNAVVGVLLQIFDRQILIRRFQDLRFLFVQFVRSDVGHFVAFQFAILTFNGRR